MHYTITTTEADQYALVLAEYYAVRIYLMCVCVFASMDEPRNMSRVHRVETKKNTPQCRSDQQNSTATCGSQSKSLQSP